MHSFPYHQQDNPSSLLLSSFRFAYLREEFTFFVARFSLAIILHHRWCPTTHPNCPYLLLLLRFRSVLFPILMVNLLGLHFFLYITLPTHADQPLKFGCLYDIFSITRFDFLIFHL